MFCQKTRSLSGQYDMANKQHLELTCWVQLVIDVEQTSQNIWAFVSSKVNPKLYLLL